MSLPADIFSEITESIAIAAPDAAADGERLSPRVPLRSHVKLLPWNDPANELSVRVRDLSTDGLGVLYSKRMALDDQFVICFPCKEQMVMGLYTIVYWEPLAENLYAIGARFDRMVEQTEVDARIVEVGQRPVERQGPLTRLGYALVRGRKAS